MIFSGTAKRYDDNINTDVIIPARYCNLLDEKELAVHCMEDLDENFSRKVCQGDILVAGKNFGCGSSREMAVTAIKASGISCIIAKSFARIFFRNAVNNALPVIECCDLVNDVKGGEKLLVNMNNGIIINSSNDRQFAFFPNDNMIIQIYKVGGLINYVKFQLEKIKTDAR